MTDQPEPWERQEGETPKQYEAFAVYRDAPLRGNRRSRAGVATALGLSANRVDEWAGRNGWKDRAALWDDHQDAEWRAEVIRERHRVAQRYVRMARSLQAKALEALQSLDVSKLSAIEVVAMIRQAKDLELSVYGRFNDEDDLLAGGHQPIIISAELVPTEHSEPVIIEAPTPYGSNGNGNGHLRAIQ